MCWPFFSSTRLKVYRRFSGPMNKVVLYFDDVIKQIRLHLIIVCM